MKIRFYFVAISIALSFLMSNSVSAQKPVISITDLRVVERGPAKIQNVTYDTYELQHTKMGLPIKFVLYAPHDSDVPAGLEDTLNSESPVLLEAIDTCVKYDCSVFEIVINFVKRAPIRSTTHSYTKTSGAKERTTRLTLYYPQGK